MSDQLPALATPAEVAEYLHTTTASLAQVAIRSKNTAKRDLRLESGESRAWAAWKPLARSRAALVSLAVVTVPMRQTRVVRWRPRRRQAGLAVRTSLLTPSTPENETTGNLAVLNGTEMERIGSSGRILPGRAPVSIRGSSTYICWLGGVHHLSLALRISRPLGVPDQ
jgi:hypothetical protein